MTREPKSAADPRPGGVPYYIDNECNECGGELILFDKLDPITIWQASGLGLPKRSPHVWHDEFVCPDCLDGVYMDWPPEKRDKILGPDNKPAGEFEFEHLEDIE